MHRHADRHPSRGPLRVLVVGTDEWAIDQATARLAGAGHTTRGCRETGSTGSPCSWLAGGACPVNDGVDVVLTVRARVAPQPAVGEMGAVCGLRAAVPLVVAGLAAPSPFAPMSAGTVDQGGDVVAACEAAATRHVIDLTAEDERASGSLPMSPR